MIDYLRLVYSPLIEEKIIATYRKYIDDNSKFVKHILNEDEQAEVSTFIIN